MSGTGHTVLNASSTLSNTPTVNARTLDNANAVTTSGTTTLQLQNGAVLNNLATGTLTFTAAGSITAPSSPTSQFNNLSQLNKTTSSTVTLSAPFNNSGTVTVSSGALVVSNGSSSGAITLVATNAFLTLPSGGTVTLQNGGTVSGAGAISMSANSTLAAVGNASVRNVNSNGNLSGAGTLTVVAGGQFAWNGGTGNLARLVNNGSLTFSSTVTLTGTVVDNAASGTLGLNSTLALQGGAVVNNLAAGTFTLTGQFITGPSSGPASQFNNAGILQKTSTNSFTISALLNNTGTITLGAGAAVVLGGGGTSTGTISLGSSANLFLHPGSLSYTLGNGAVVNGGTFKSTAEPST